MVYLGHEIYAILSPANSGKPVRLAVWRDDAPVPVGYRGSDLEVDPDGQTYVTVDAPRLYYLIVNEDQEYHELKISPREENVLFYSFTFSNYCLSEFEHR